MYGPAREGNRNASRRGSIGPASERLTVLGEASRLEELELGVADADDLVSSLARAAKSRLDKEVVGRDAVLPGHQEVSR